MDLLNAFIKSCGIGMAIAVPVGPVSTLSMRSSLGLGIKGAIAVGLGSALGDTFYGIIAVFGLHKVADLLLFPVFKMLGGITLLMMAYIELKGIKSTSEPLTPTSRLRSLVTLFLKAAALTLANPITVIALMGFLASFLGGYMARHTHLWVIAIGICCGAFLWWYLLGIMTIKVQQRFSKDFSQGIRYCSSLVLFLFGSIAIIMGVVQQYEQWF